MEEVPPSLVLPAEEDSSGWVRDRIPGAPALVWVCLFKLFSVLSFFLNGQDVKLLLQFCYTCLIISFREKMDR